MSQKPKKRRNATICKLYLTGNFTMQDIADRYAITHERVRQILRREGVTYTNRHVIVPDNVIYRALQDPNITTMSELAAASGLSPNSTTSRFRRLPDVRKILYARRQALMAEKDKKLLAGIRKVGLKLGHTPRMEDLLRAGFAHRTLVMRFGSLRRAQELAGFKPNPNGRPLSFRREAANWAKPTDEVANLGIDI